MQSSHSAPLVSAHPNAQVLKKFYDQLLSGHIAEALASVDEKFTFAVPGKSKFAAKYTAQTFPGYWTAILERAQFEIHDIMASDQHATVLLTARTKNAQGIATELRAVHVYRFQGSKPLAGYEYPRDLYLFEQTLG
jgi:ketosteroid isomerase-like protein